MAKQFIWALLLAAGVLGSSGSRAADPEGTSEGVTSAFKAGTFNINFRYRLEQVDQDGVPQDATASTLRTRLTYQTAAFRDFALLLEVDDLRPVGSSDYNSTRNGKGTRPSPEYGRRAGTRSLR